LPGNIPVGFLSKTLGNATVSAAATKADGTSGTVIKTLESASLVSLSSPSGDLIKTLANATISATSTKGDVGNTIRILANASLTSSGVNINSASGGVNKTLSNATLSSASISVGRALSTQMVTEINASLNRPIFFFETVLSGSTLRLWSGTGPINWNGFTWQGDSTLISIQLASETNEIRSTGIEVSLNGSSSSVVSLVLSDVKMGQSGKVWFGFLTSAGAEVSTPYLLFSGLFDTAEIDENDQAPEIVLRYETKLVELERGKTFRYTTDNQRIFNATDRGFEYVPTIQDWNGYWGPKAKKPIKQDKKKQVNKK
jgi:heat shock protein HslJ